MAEMPKTIKQIIINDGSLDFSDSQNEIYATIPFKLNIENLKDSIQVKTYFENGATCKLKNKATVSFNAQINLFAKNSEHSVKGKVFSIFSLDGQQSIPLEFCFDWKNSDVILYMKNDKIKNASPIEVKIKLFKFFP